MNRVRRIFGWTIFASGAATAVLSLASGPAWANALLQNAQIAQGAGEVNLYSSRHYNTDEKLYQDFTKATGIKINRIEADADPLIRRMKADDQRLAERFELYVCGLELANAFGELTDAAEQRRRFLADQQARRARVGHAYPIDEDFLAALEHGMPEASGIALGVDRLVMLATGAADIADVLWAPVADAAGDEI